MDTQEQRPAPQTHEHTTGKRKPQPRNLAVAGLHKLGKLKFLIARNVDNLHLESGIPHNLLAEPHGNITKLRYVSCGKTVDRSLGLKVCQCGGNFVSSVVGFGQPLSERGLSLSFENSRKSDLFIVVGSSLAVTPAADIPREALRSGARLIIINQEEPPWTGMPVSVFSKGFRRYFPGRSRD